MEEVRQELIKDQLLPAGSKSFSLEVTGERFLVNGKEQSKEMHEKYLRLIHPTQGLEGNKKESFHFQWKTDGKDSSLEMEEQ